MQISETISHNKFTKSLNNEKYIHFKNRPIELRNNHLCYILNKIEISILTNELRNSEDLIILKQKPQYYIEFNFQGHSELDNNIYNDKIKYI